MTLKYPGGWRSGVGILAALLASGCAAVPDLGPKPMPAAATSLASERSLPASDGAAWPADSWWTRYKDPELNALVAEGLANAPTLAAAAARLRKAQALSAEAGAADLPQLSASGGVGETKASYNNGVSYAAVPKGVNETANARLNLAWDLDLFGRNRAALAATVSAAEAARADAAQARLVLTTAIAGTYADLLGQMRDVHIAIDTVRVRDRTAALVEQRRVQGLETLAAAGQARSAAETARQAEGAAVETVQLTQYRLAALIGAGPDRAQSITIPTEPTLAAIGLPANVPAELIGRRPDLRAARLRVEASARRIQVARAGFYPSVNLAAAIGPQVLGLGAFFKPASLAGSIGPAISLPIFEGGALSARYRGARADYDEAVANYDDTLVRALQDVASATTSQRALVDQQRHAAAALREAQAAYNAADLRYRGGLSTYIAVLTAENTLIAARRAVSQLDTRAFSLDVALARALGGGA